MGKSKLRNNRLIDMAKALGKTDATKPTDFVIALEELKGKCNVLGLKLSNYGIKKEDIPMYAKDAYETMGGLFACDPKEMPIEDCIKIYEESYM